MENNKGFFHRTKHNNWTSSRSWWWTGKPDVLQSMGSQSWAWLSDWTEAKYGYFYLLLGESFQSENINPLQKKGSGPGCQTSESLTLSGSTCQQCQHRKRVWCRHGVCLPYQLPEMKLVIITQIKNSRWEGSLVMDGEKNANTESSLMIVLFYKTPGFQTLPWDIFC